MVLGSDKQPYRRTEEARGGLGSSRTAWRHRLPRERSGRRLYRYRATGLHADEGPVAGTARVREAQIPIYRVGRGTGAPLRRGRGSDGPSIGGGEVRGLRSSGPVPRDVGLREATGALAAGRPPPEPYRRETLRACSHHAANILPGGQRGATREKIGGNHYLRHRQ